MKRLFKKWKWTEYVESVLLILLGILVICFNSSKNLYSAIGYIVGTYLLINALLLIVSSIVFSLPLLSGDFLSGLILLVISVGLFVDPLILVEILPLVIGVGLIGIGLILISVAIKTFVFKGNGVIQILQLVFGAIAATIGTSIVVVHYATDNNVVGVLFVLLGLILLFSGITQLCFALYVSYHAKKFTDFESVKESEVVEEYKEK